MATNDTHAIADRLAEAGQRPTLAAVRKELGGGSFTTISEAMKTWHEAQQQEHALGEVQVPDTVSEPLGQLQATLWQAAVGEAERRLATERATDAETAKAHAEQLAAAAQATATAQLEGLQARLADAKATIESLVAKIAEDKEPSSKTLKK